MKRILIVDDDRLICSTVKDILENEGYEIILAFNSDEAIAKSTDIIPDLIILDLNIPTAGGIEVCKILRKEKKTKAIPIIILTGYKDEENKLLGLGVGADDYITKPFQIKEFITRVKTVLRRIKYKKLKNNIE